MEQTIGKQNKISESKEIHFHAKMYLSLTVAASQKHMSFITGLAHLTNKTSTTKNGAFGGQEFSLLDDQRPIIRAITCISYSGVAGS